MSGERSERSTVLPSDPFDLALAEKIGLPDGAHTPQQLSHSIDFYGNSTTSIVQTVRDAKGLWVFVQQLTSGPPKRFVLDPRALQLIDRQRDSITTQLRRRHGKRLAETRGAYNPFTPEMRAKALEARKRNARKKR